MITKCGLRLLPQRILSSSAKWGESIILEADCIHACHMGSAGKVKATFVIVKAVKIQTIQREKSILFLVT